MSLVESNSISNNAVESMSLFESKGSSNKMVSSASREAASYNATKGAGSLTKHAAELGRWSRAASTAAVALLAFDRMGDSHGALFPWGPTTGSSHALHEYWMLGMFRWQELVMVLAACLLAI